MAQGKTNKQIVQELWLAESTVKVHVSAIFRALNVHDWAGLSALLGGRALAKKTKTQSE